MAIHIDEQARAAVARRRARGRDATITVQVASIPARGAMHQLVAEWAPRNACQRLPVSRNVGDVTVQLGARVARYADWHEVTISAWRLGPFERLTVLDEPRVLMEMLAWERTHPQAETPIAV